MNALVLVLVGAGGRTLRSLVLVMATVGAALAVRHGGFPPSEMRELIVRNVPAWAGLLAALFVWEAAVALRRARTRPEAAAGAGGGSGDGA